jgi:hypothetical protein
MKGETASMLLPYGTPIFPPQTLHVAGTAGPKKALRIVEMPSLLQCGQVYTGSLLITARAIYTAVLTDEKAVFLALQQRSQRKPLGGCLRNFLEGAWRPSLVHRGRHRVCFQKIPLATARWYDAGERMERNAQ